MKTEKKKVEKENEKNTETYFEIWRNVKELQEIKERINLCGVGIKA